MVLFPDSPARGGKRKIGEIGLIGPIGLIGEIGPMILIYKNGAECHRTLPPSDLEVEIARRWSYFLSGGLDAGDDVAERLPSRPVPDPSHTPIRDERSQRPILHIH